MQPDDEIRHAADLLDAGATPVPAGIAHHLGVILRAFADTEYDRHATVQVTDGRHLRMLRLARAVNAAPRT